MNVLVILKKDFLYTKKIFYIKGFCTECAPYFCV